MAGKRTLGALLCGPLLLLACQRPGATGASPASAQAQKRTQAQTQPQTPATGAGNDLDAAPSKTTALQVQTVRARAGGLSVSRTASGTVKSSRDSDVAAQASGAVGRVLASVGDRVRTGQAVIALEDSALRQSVTSARLQLQNARITLQQGSRNSGQDRGQLQASLTSAEAALSKARQTATANRDLYRLGGVSRADLTASQAALAQAQADLAQTRNALDQNGQGGTVSLPLLQNQVAQAGASLTQAESSLSKATVRAPFAGVIASLPLSQGEYMQTGATAFRLVDTSALSVDFKVAPEDAAGLPTGTPLNLSYGDSKLTGKVRDGDRVAGTDRLVPVSVRLDGAPALPVGGAVQVRYRLKLGGGAGSGLQIPVSAIQQIGGGNVVFLRAGGLARQTPVGIVAEAGSLAVVSGLRAGDEVINPVPPGLSDGASVGAGSGLPGTGLPGSGLPGGQP